MKKKNHIVVTSIPNKFIGALVLKYMDVAEAEIAHIYQLGPDQFPMYIHIDWKEFLDEGIWESGITWSHGQNYGWVKNKPQIDWKEFLKDKCSVEELIDVLWRSTDSTARFRNQIKNTLELSGYY